MGIRGILCAFRVLQASTMGYDCRCLFQLCLICSSFLHCPCCHGTWHRARLTCSLLRRREAVRLHGCLLTLRPHHSAQLRMSIKHLALWCMPFVSRAFPFLAFDVGSTCPPTEAQLSSWGFTRISLESRHAAAYLNLIWRSAMIGEVIRSNRKKMR